MRQDLGVPSRPQLPIGALRRSFGGTPGAYADSPNWHGGTFRNRLPGTVVSPDQRGSLMLDALTRRRPPRPQIPVERPDLPASAAHGAATWLGHSTVLLEVGGHWVLTDPVFSDRVSPSAKVGPRRLHPAPLRIAELPALDAVIISHDHYDHLDLASVEALAQTGVCFVVPLGVGAHFRAWGVDPRQVVELDWGDSHRIGELTLGCVEARHFSGRLFSRNRTLWSSWTVSAGGWRVFFGGDTGYTPAFKELSDGHGAFDLTVLPIGAYDPRWADIHMDPAEAVRTHLDVRGEVLLPIHWASFNLAFHPWAEPVEWLTREAAEHGVRLATPRVGQRFEVVAPPTDPWWQG